MWQAALWVTCKTSWTTGRSDLHARAGYVWCTTQLFITGHAGTATRRKTEKNPKSFLLLSLIPPYLLVCCILSDYWISGWCKLKDFPPFPFSEQLIGKLTSDVHLHLSSLTHFNSGKISTTEQLAMLLTRRLKKARKGTETLVFIGQRNYIKARKSQTEIKEMSSLVTSSLLPYYNLIYFYTYFSVSCLSGWCCMTLANASYSERHLNS